MVALKGKSKEVVEEVVLLANKRCYRNARSDINRIFHLEHERQENIQGQYFYRQ